MTDLNISNLNMNSDKYIFKKKLNFRRKSKKRLFIESTFMFFFSLLLVYMTYLIPDKKSLLINLPNNFNTSFKLINDLFLNFIDIFLVIFIILSLFTALILLIGSFSRVIKLYNGKTRKKSYR